MLVAIGVLRASGALDLVLDGLRVGVAGRAGHPLGRRDAHRSDAAALGKRSARHDARDHEGHGADSFAGRLVSIIQGSTETTFYVLAVYFGSVGIRRFRHAPLAGLAADPAGIIAAIAVTYLFFG